MSHAIDGGFRYVVWTIYQIFSISELSAHKYTEQNDTVGFRPEQEPRIFFYSQWWNEAINKDDVAKFSVINACEYHPAQTRVRALQ